MRESLTHALREQHVHEMHVNVLPPNQQVRFFEEPQLVVGNKTVLKPGMVFAVDGGSSAKDFRGQVGDSFIITEDGYEQITHHSKAIEDLILN